MSQNSNQQSTKKNNNNTYPYMYQYNNMYPTQPHYNRTPQTPINFQQSNSNYLSNTPVYQQPIYSKTSTPTHTYQPISNYSTPISNSYTTPSKLPTQDEIREKMNLLSQRKLQEQQKRPQQWKQGHSSTMKPYTVEEIYKGRPLSESFKRFQERTYQANPYNYKDVKAYLDNVLVMLGESNEFYDFNWDNTPVKTFESKPQSSETLTPIQSYNTTRNKSTPYVDMSKYDYTKKKSKQGDHPYTPLPVSSRSYFNEKIRQPHDYQNYSPMYESTPRSTVKGKPKKIVGTLLTLEKEYFRNADEPDPSNVRPLYILERSFEYIKSRVLEGADWIYISNQMKSIRQDLVIQGIKSEFTVDVYETHARLCLEQGDIDEYNRCQGKLKELYNDEIPGNIFEFLAYRILYNVYTGNVLEMNSVLNELNERAQEREEIKHALKVRESIALNNWHKFFLLYKDCPNMGRFIMKRMFRKVRINSLRMIYIAFRPTISVTWISNELGFESLDECKKFLTEIRANFHDEENLNTKLSLKGLREYENQD